MSRLDRYRKLLRTKIVYWGPEGSGKTRSLLELRRQIDPEDRLRLYSVNGAGERTLFFDLLALEEFPLGPLRVRTRVVAVPGGAEAAAARARLLEGVDVIVFVAESQRGEMEANRASLAELEAALWARRIDPLTVPIVWAFNKQDLPEAAPPAEARWVLSAREGPAYETDAASGAGLAECFREAFRRMVEGAAASLALPSGDVETALDSKLLPALVRGNAARPGWRSDEERRVVVHVGEPAAAEEAEGSGEAEPEHDPLASALDAQVALAELCADGDVQQRLLQERNRELMALNRVSRSILGAMEIENLLMVLLDATTEHLRVSHASCVVFDPADPQNLQTHVLGFGRDPILEIEEAPAAAFFRLLSESDGPIPLDRDRNEGLLYAVRAADGRVVRAVFAPIKTTDKPAGWIGIYRLEDAPLLGAQGLLFLSSVARLAAIGLERIALVDRVQRFSAKLEAEIRERTSLLEMANAKIRALNRGLEARVAERTRALEDVNLTLRAARADAARGARLREMGQLAAAFSEEVEGPANQLRERLAGLKGSLDDLRGKVAAGRAEEALLSLEGFEKELSACEVGSARIGGVVKGLRRFGETPRPNAPFALNAAIADALTLMEERIRRCADLDLRLGSLPEMRGDALELSHVVLAVLGNAVEGLERRNARGSLEITTFAAGGRVTLLVRDTGAGIPEERLARLFDPLADAKGPEASVGLGLHAAYQTVLRHQGTIKVRSKVGEGTTVNVVIPVEPARADEPVKDESAARSVPAD